MLSRWRVEAKRLTKESKHKTVRGAVSEMQRRISTDMIIRILRYFLTMEIDRVRVKAIVGLMKYPYFDCLINQIELERSSMSYLECHWEILVHVWWIFVHQPLLLRRCHRNQRARHGISRLSRLDYWNICCPLSAMSSSGPARSLSNHSIVCVAFSIQVDWSFFADKDQQGSAQHMKLRFLHSQANPRSRSLGSTGERWVDILEWIDHNHIDDRQCRK